MKISPKLGLQKFVLRWVVHSLLQRSKALRKSDRGDPRVTYDKARWVWASQLCAAWWFGSGLEHVFSHIFPYIGKNHPNWLIFFRWVETTNQVWLVDGSFMFRIPQILQDFFAPGKRWHRHGKIHHFFCRKIYELSMASLNSYVKLPEGNRFCPIPISPKFVRSLQEINAQSLLKSSCDFSFSLGTPNFVENNDNLRNI